MRIFILIFFIIVAAALEGCKEDEIGELTLQHVFVGTTEISQSEPISSNLPLDRSISLVFSGEINPDNLSDKIDLLSGSSSVNISATVFGNTITVFPSAILSSNSLYTLAVSNTLRGKKGEKFQGAEIEFQTKLDDLTVSSISIAGQLVDGNNIVVNVPLSLSIEINFSAAVDVNSAMGAIKLTGTSVPALALTFSNNNKTCTLTPNSSLPDFKKYILTILNTLKGSLGEPFTEKSATFYTGKSSTPKFPVISDDDLLTKVQQQTFKFFYNYAEPTSGMARERLGSGNTVTTGGTGFGLMATVVAMERNFITRQQGIDHLKKIVTFLETADRFHGVWSHWVNGATGKVIPFSVKDDGGDLVETSFLIQGLLTFRQYLTGTDTIGNNLINRITKLYNDVEWDWYRKNNENVLYWHWSPNYNWDMNFPMYGYFEQQITYILAAASPTHTIPKIVYANGYGKNGQIKTNNTYYTVQLPLGGLFPLFWTHYSYLGMNPHFSDDYTNYWTQNVNASKINYSYCVANPKKYVAYGENCWGLTSSDVQNGYNANSPSNDVGVISPTAALSAFPYTPDESMKALKFFYYTYGDRLWGDYGFYDAFNITTGWTASSYLAIDQGPIIVMIENYRTGLLWNLFMSCPELENAKTKLGLIY